jgi:PD-(D/E)XK nuclease superfamily protein
MRPTTISASALTNFHDCPAKFRAINIQHVPETGRKDPARLGKVCHYALQHFVNLTRIKKSHKWTLEFLLELFDEGYMVEMESGDFSSDWYAQGHEMMIRWFHRTDLHDVEVLAVEEKHRINVPSVRYDRTAEDPAAEGGRVVPMSYIWDRVDRYVDPNTGERVIRVVDYKSQHVPPPSLDGNVQARTYALAAVIHFKDEMPDKIVVMFDLLRFERPMIKKFTPQDTVAIWRDLRRDLQVIIDMPEHEATRNLGPGCRYCPISATCAERARNLVGGGIMSLSLVEQIALRRDLEAQLKADTALAAEIDLQIKKEAVELDSLDFSAEDYVIEISSGTLRRLDVEEARCALGLELYGSLAPITMKLYDQLMRDEDERLTEKQKESLAQCVTVKYKEPSVKITMEEE